MSYFAKLIRYSSGQITKLAFYNLGYFFKLKIFYKLDYFRKFRVREDLTGMDTYKISFEITNNCFLEAYFNDICYIFGVHIDFCFQIQDLFQVHECSASLR